MHFSEQKTKNKKNHLANMSIKGRTLSSSSIITYVVFKTMTTQKVLLLCCLVLISLNQLQGFFNPPKTPPLSKNCRKEIAEEVHGSQVAEIQPMSFYHKSNHFSLGK